MGIEPLTFQLVEDPMNLLNHSLPKAAVIIIIILQ